MTSDPMVAADRLDCRSAWERADSVLAVSQSRRAAGAPRPVADQRLASDR